MKSNYISDHEEEQDQDRLWPKLASVKSELLAKIEVLAREANTDGLLKANDWLRACVSLEKRGAVLMEETKQVIQRGADLLNPGPSAPPAKPDERLGSDEEDNSPADSEQITGGKARGRECRAAFVRREAQRGQVLRRLEGQLFVDPSGVIIGIAYGAEREKRKNIWFLGLPAQKFQAAVLLCEPLGGSVVVIRLPREFIERYGRHLSVSKEFHQAKFRIDRREGRYELSTSVGPVDLSAHTDAELLSCPRAEYA